MSIWSLIAAILPLSLGLPPDATSGNEGLSHLDAHLRAQPPGALVRPLGSEDPKSIPKGLEPVPEGALTTALLAQNLHSRLLRVAIASNGWITAGLVKLQVGDKQSELISLRDLQQDVARVITTAFVTVPDLAHLDCWATVPGEREFTDYHRPVLSVSATREEVADLLSAPEDPARLLARCGCVRVDDLLLQYAIDAPDAAGVRQLLGDALQGPSLQDHWTQFGAQGRQSGELDNLPREGPVSAIVEGDPASGMVALTIDDGPRPLTTPLVLDVLKRWGVRATFFLVGENAEQFPELVRMIARDGHEIGNHTYSHIPLPELNPRGVWTQLRGCDQAIEAASGVKPRLMRPPGGACSELALRVSDQLRYETVLWTANSGDWRSHSRDAIVANGLSRVRSGSIILMHQGDLWSLDALPHVLQGIQQAGLKVGTVSEAVNGTPTPQWQPAELVALAKRAHVDPYEQGRRSDG
jgi:peptidoglycan/xylan/chitin deacetylase (PgdA/CDA1 family)